MERTLARNTVHQVSILDRDNIFYSLGFKMFLIKTSEYSMTHLVTTLILTQNFIPLKRFSSVINIISLVPSIQSRKLDSFDVFLHEMNKFGKKKHCFALRSEFLCLKYIFL